MEPDTRSQIILSTDSGTYYTGVSVEPWSDNPAEARVYADPREAWQEGLKLEAQSTAMLEGSRLELHLRNPDDPQDARRALSLAAENNRPAMRNAWSNEFGEPLPIDLPAPPIDNAQTVRHMAEYLQDVDWDAVSKADPGLGLDQSFRDGAARIADTLPGALPTLWQQHAPAEIPLPDLHLGQVQAQDAGMAGGPDAAPLVMEERLVLVTPQGNYYTGQSEMNLADYYAGYMDAPAPWSRDVRHARIYGTQASAAEAQEQINRIAEQHRSAETVSIQDAPDVAAMKVAEAMPTPAAEVAGVVRSHADEAIIAPPSTARPDPAAEAFRAASANVGHAMPEGLPEPSDPAPRATPAISDRAAALGELETYLAAVDWAAIREQHQGAPQTRGEIGLDPKFWSTAARLSLSTSGKEAIEQMWARHAPEDFPPPFQDTAAKRAEPQENEVRQGERTAAPTEAPATATGPAQIDADEVLARAAAARARDPAQAPPRADQPNEVQRGSRERDPDPRAPATPAATAKAPGPDAALPTYVRRHFVHTGDDFYYRNEPTKLGFQAKGDTFKAKDPSVAVATALVEMAQAKGWGSIKVKGTDEFKQRVYAAALERGLKVEGYTPTPGEKVAHDERKAPGARPFPEALAAGNPPRPSAAPDQSAADPITTAPRASGFRGALESHGAAPYKDQPKGSASYYVRLRDPEGAVHTHWGVDLRRAVEESGVKPGDAVQVAREGRQPVTVKVREVDADGKVSFAEKPVQREVWSVRPQERSPAAEAVRTLVDRTMPNLDAAVRERLMERVREQQVPDVAPATKAPPAGPNEVAKGRTPDRATDARSR